MGFKRSEGGNLVEIDGKVRVEAGHVRKRAIATVELLNDEVTAGHYQVGMPDSHNKPIVLGEMMDYIDWRSEARAFYVYQLTTTLKVKMKAGGGTTTKPHWDIKGTYATEEEAITAALALLAHAK